MLHGTHQPTNRIADDYVPEARIEDLVQSHSGDESLLYDRRNHHIHHLNAECASVWRLSDGTRSVREIAEQAGINLEQTRYALSLLAREALLQSPLPPSLGMYRNRRAFMKKLAIASLPAIVSIAAPTAKAAASGFSRV